jgi:PKD repeat protein
MDCPHISYYDSTNGDLKYARWMGSFWANQTIDSGGDVGKYTSIALDSNDYPHISYYDSTNGDLKYAKWTGSSWTNETVDSVPNVGRATSIAIDNNDNPHISYYDASNKNLKYANKNGISWYSETVDSLGDVGRCTSLVLDSKTSPHIAYFDYGNWDLEYAKKVGDTLLYEWDFGDGVTSTLQNPSHVYGDDGIFTATLTVTDNQGLTDTDTCIVTVINVNPTVTLESASMDVEIGIRVAGSKWSNVGLTLYEDEVEAGYLEVERWPGNPDDNPTYENPTLPTTIDISKSYRAVVTYDPYPDNGDEIEGDQPNNGKDKKDNAGNPVWIILRFADGNETRIHHTFNTEQSMIRDSEHTNHVEPWEVNISAYLIGHPFHVTANVTDPGSDDETLIYTYGTQTVNITYLNNPPVPDPYPSPEVNPRNITDVTHLSYEGPGTLELSVVDDDGGSCSTSVFIG